MSGVLFYQHPDIFRTVAGSGQLWLYINCLRWKAWILLSGQSSMIVKRNHSMLFLTHLSSRVNRHAFHAANIFLLNWVSFNWKRAGQPYTWTLVSTVMLNMKCRVRILLGLYLFGMSPLQNGEQKNPLRDERCAKTCKSCTGKTHFAINKHLQKVILWSCPTWTHVLKLSSK